MIEPGLQAHLASGVAEHVGSRVFPGRMPDKTKYPALTYELVGGSSVHTHQGPSGLAEGRYQVVAWDTRYLAAKALADATREVLDGFRGAWSGHVVASVRLDGERDFYDAAGNVWQVQADYLIQFTR